MNSKEKIRKTTFITTQCIHLCMVRKPLKNRKPTKNPMDSKMPTIRVMKSVKDELFEISEKGETYSEVIQRLIEYYKATKD